MLSYYFCLHFDIFIILINIMVLKYITYGLEIVA